MKILYIDNRKYGHNSDIHVDFFTHLNKTVEVIPYGKYLNRHFKNAILPGKNATKELTSISNKHKIDAIITYNCNGSSYEVKLDNTNIYKWCEDYLKNVDLPKFHITTDYCRSGFRKEQADWFKDFKYTAALFRHKIALDYPLDIPKVWLPFSVDKKLYNKNSIDVDKKQKFVGFIGAAHNSAKDLYKNRIAAIDYLINKNKLKTTQILNNKNFERKMLFGSEYVKFITSNLFGLVCGGTCNFMTAKYFQIPAANSMLICTNTVGLEIFPKETYIEYDINNLEKLYNDILFHETNMNLTKEKIQTLNQYVINNHSHQKRADELISLIRSYS